MVCGTDDPCTIRSCDPELGCLSAPRCVDGDPCTDDICDEGRCSFVDNEQCIKCSEKNSCEACNEADCAWLECDDVIGTRNLTVDGENRINLFLSTVQLNTTTLDSRNGTSGNTTTTIERRVLNACFPQSLEEEVLNLTRTLETQILEANGKNDTAVENVCKVRIQDCQVTNDDAPQNTENKLEQNRKTIAAAAGGAAGSVVGGTACLWGGTLACIAYRRKRKPKNAFDLEAEDEWQVQTTNELFTEKDRGAMEESGLYGAGDDFNDF